MLLERPLREQDPRRGYLSQRQGALLPASCMTLDGSSDCSCQLPGMSAGTHKTPPAVGMQPWELCGMVALCELKLNSLFLRINSF